MTELATTDTSDPTPTSEGLLQPAFRLLLDERRALVVANNAIVAELDPLQRRIAKRRRAIGALEDLLGLDAAGVAAIKSGLPTEGGRHE